ncbi:MAG: DUF721 domain-containing protein [Prevotellaceae bacterium]|nr:DUF721 domain-containing protein [Candidatus Minthosoma caballi]
MRRRNTEQIGDVVLQFMRQEGIETPYNQYRVIKAWPQIMGESIQKYTTNIFIKNQTLNIQLSSPALKQNLQAEHRSLARKLNEFIGAQVIEDVRFY